MTQKVRAKMVLNGIQDHGGSLQYTFGAVYSQDPLSENARYSEATPNGYLNIGISKKSAAPEVQAFLTAMLNDEVYIDIIPAPSDRIRYLMDSFPLDNKKVQLRFGPDGEWQDAVVATEPTGQSNFTQRVAYIGDKRIQQYAKQENGLWTVDTKGWYWRYVE